MDWKFGLGLIVAAVGSLYQVLAYYQAKRLAGEGMPTMRRPHVFAGIFMLLTWAAVGYDLYDRSVRFSSQWSERPLIQVRDQKFRAQTVLLDGYEYINCDFNEVSFEFEGTAPSRLTNSHLHIDKAGSQMGITSQNPVVRHTLVIVDALNKAAGITDSKLEHK